MKRHVEHMEKPEECCSCRFQTEELTEYDPPFMSKRTTKWLCRLCASTMAGNAYDYPDQYRGQTDIMQTVCFVGNTILRAIGEVALGRATAPWWQSLARQVPGVDLDAAMRQAFNSCHKGVTPGGISLEELDRAAQKVADELFPQDRTAVSSVLGDTCPRCGGQLDADGGRWACTCPRCPRCNTPGDQDDCRECHPARARD